MPRLVETHRANVPVDERRKLFLLSTVSVVRRELSRALGVMGITVPSVM